MVPDRECRSGAFRSTCVATMNNRILFVEDEAALAEIVREVLESKGFEVTHVDGIAQALKLLQRQSFDLLIFDVMLPDGDGYTLLKYARRIGVHAPALFLTAKSLPSDVVQGFESGANDYIKKPFSMEELLIRMKSMLGLLNQTDAQENNSPREFSLGEYTFLYPQGLLIRQGQLQKLTFREAEILYFLISKKAQIITRKELLIKFWSTDDYFSGRSLDVFITKLRRYLANDPAIAILNFRGQGYKLIC